MRTYLIILLSFSLFSCRQRDTLNEYYIIEYDRYEQFDYDPVPESIFKIKENDTIIFCYYKCQFKGNSYMIVPSLYVGLINKADKNLLIKSISDCNLFYNLSKSRNCSNLIYDLSCTMNGIKIREVCVDSTKFDDNFKFLIKVTKKIADTLSLEKIDFLENQEKYNIGIPPAFNEYQKMHP